MSRVPVYLAPPPSDLRAVVFEALSEEWSAQGKPHVKVATITYDPVRETCTIVPEAIWVSEGQFPPSTWVGDANAIAQVMAQRAEYPFYSVRLFQQASWFLQARGRGRGKHADA